jgi:pilus assembly protein CpaB
MSRTAAAMNPGKSNRRFVMLAVTLGLLGAILVYVAFARSGGSGKGGSAADSPVVVAKVDIPARVRITQAMVEVKLVSAETRSNLAFASVPQVVGQVTRFPLAANEQILQTKVVPLTGPGVAAGRSLSYVVPQGKRAFAIGISDLGSAGGLILPGDYVDVLVMYDVEFRNAGGGTQKADNFLVQTMMQNVEVLAVAQGIVDVVPEATPTANGQRVRNTEGRATPGAATVTLSLTPEQAERMYVAEGNGKIRLALRSYGDAEERPVDHVTELELFPPNLPNPFLR